MSTAIYNPQISPQNENMIFWIGRTNEEAQSIFDFESEQA
mgnify:CR=1 FL=1